MDGRSDRRRKRKGGNQRRGDFEREQGRRKEMSTEKEPRVKMSMAEGGRIDREEKRENR